MDADRARSLLTAELADLDERARFAQEARAESTGEPDAPAQDAGDYGREVAAAMDGEMLVDTVADQRRLVQDALARLDEGSYGRCGVCGREIDDERLEARPEAATCREHAVPAPL